MVYGRKRNVAVGVVRIGMGAGDEFTTTATTMSIPH